MLDIYEIRQLIILILFLGIIGVTSTLISGEETDK